MNDTPLKVWLERDGALLRLRLAKPKANLIDAAMIAALRSAFKAHRDNPGLLAALVDHEGPHFSFGASVEEHLPEQCEQMLKSLHSLLGLMLDWPRPILMAVRGQCLGGGLELRRRRQPDLRRPGRAARPARDQARRVRARRVGAAAALRVGQARAEDLLLPGALDHRAARRDVGAGDTKSPTIRRPRR